MAQTLRVKININKINRILDILIKNNQNNWSQSNI